MALNSLHEFKHSFKQLMVILIKLVQQTFKKIPSQNVLSRDSPLVWLLQHTLTSVPIKIPMENELDCANITYITTGQCSDCTEIENHVLKKIEKILKLLE